MDDVRVKKLEDYSNLELAYLGDAVWEIEVRKYCLNFGYKINKLNKLVTKYVRASTQALFYEDIFKDLDETGKNLLKRYQNSNIKTFPHSCTAIEYRKATAFEAYIAMLYLSGNNEKIEEIIKNKIKREVV